jgi:hypothetical protein
VDKRDNTVKNPRAEIRTECPVRMTLSLNREVETWEIILPRMSKSDC